MKVGVGNTVWDVIGMSLSSVCSSILPANDTSNAFHHCADRLTLLREVTEEGREGRGGSDRGRDRLLLHCALMSNAARKHVV